MCTVANLDYSGTWRRPVRLRISPEKLKVYDRVNRSALDKILKDWRPAICAETPIHVIKYFFAPNAVGPALC